MIAYATTFTTPVGPFSLAVDDRQAVLATVFGDLAALAPRLPARRVVEEPDRTADARGQLMAYFKGEHTGFDLPLAAAGSAFQHRVWSALAKIPLGETRSYGQLAAALGLPGAARAVGRANATNPICVITPCHRVIGADGSLTGFAYGEKTKRWLLDHEAALCGRSDLALR